MASATDELLDLIGRWERESCDLVPTFASDTAAARSDMADKIRRAAGHMRSQVERERDQLDKAAAAGVDVKRAYRVKATSAVALEFLSDTPVMSELKWNKETYYEMRFIE